MEEMYITVTGFAKHYGKKPFNIGNVLICVKDPANKYDSEAITVRLPFIGLVGYVANGVQYVAAGTMSAGRIYDKVEDKFYARVMFVTQSKVICRVENGSAEDLDKEIAEQMKENEDALGGKQG